MLRATLKGQRLVAVILLGCVLLNYPFLRLVDGPQEVFGIPVLFAYVFGVWAALIALMAYIIEKRGDTR